MTVITVTEAIKNNQMRGLALGSKFGYEVSIIKNFDSELSIEDIKHLYQKLSFLEKSYKPLQRLDENNKLTKSTVEFLTNGGSAGLAFARLELRKAGILKSFTNDISDSELNKEEELPKIEMQVAKALNEELMQVTYVAMKADSTDLHGDFTTADEVRKAKESFNKALIQKQTMSNLFHMFETTAFDVIESYLAPADMSLNGHLVQKSDWLVTLQINDESLWEMVKKGEVVGLSIGAVASVETLEESEE